MSLDSVVCTTNKTSLSTFLSRFYQDYILPAGKCRTKGLEQERIVQFLFRVNHWPSNQHLHFLLSDKLWTISKFHFLTDNQSYRPAQRDSHTRSDFFLLPGKRRLVLEMAVKVAEEGGGAGNYRGGRPLCPGVTSRFLPE